MRTKLFNALKVSALALLLSFGLSFVYAWTAPTANPPAGNVSAPINTSSTAQTKAGNLTISATTTSSYFADLVNPAFFVQPSGESKFWNTTTAGTTTTNGLKVLSGAGANKVLTSDANGNASWQVGGGVTSLVAGTNITLSPASGVGVVTVNASGLGVGQTWQCGASRSPDVSYTNNTGKPIAVGSSITNATWRVNGVIITAASNIVVVPDGSTYMVSNGGNANINVSGWCELR